MTSKQTKLEHLLETEITQLGYEFVGCLFKQERRGTLLRVYVDKIGGGILIDDCSKITRHINSVLDVEDPIESSYTLEVSSPGLERPLFKPAHYQQAVGKRIKLKLHAPREGQRNFSGLLNSATDETITLRAEKGDITLPYSEIDKAHVELVFPGKR